MKRRRRIRIDENPRKLVKQSIENHSTTILSPPKQNLSLDIITEIIFLLPPIPYYFLFQTVCKSIREKLQLALQRCKDFNFLNVKNHSKVIEMVKNYKSNITSLIIPLSLNEISFYNMIKDLQRLNSLIIPFYNFPIQHLMYSTSKELNGKAWNEKIEKITFIRMKVATREFWPIILQRFPNVKLIELVFCENPKRDPLSVFGDKISVVTQFEFQ